MTDERPGIDYLQTAARELIKAARTMLDAVEEVVDDPEAIGVAVGALGRMAREVLHTVQPGAGDQAGGPDDTGGPDDDIQHIPVD